MIEIIWVFLALCVAIALHTDCYDNNYYETYSIPACLVVICLTALVAPIFITVKLIQKLL